jgi:hypothetical protein
VRTRHFIDLPSSVCSITAKDCAAAVKAGDLVEIQRWTEGTIQERVATLIVIYRTPDRVGKVKFFDAVGKVDARDDATV